MLKRALEAARALLQAAGIAGARRRPAPEKHLPYFKFVKSASRPGCPVCNEASAALDDWYENLMYESANDRPLRHRFDAEKGLCKEHAHRMNASNDGLGAAVIYRSILEASVASLGALSPPPLNEGSCVACDAQADAEGRYVGLVADFIEEPEMRAALEASSGLCMPHLAAVLQRRRSLGLGSPEWLFELHRARCATLLEVLVRYIDCQKLSTEERKQRLSFEDEMAWKRLAPLLTGEKDK